MILCDYCDNQATWRITHAAIDKTSKVVCAGRCENATEDLENAAFFGWTVTPYGREAPPSPPPLPKDWIRCKGCKQPRTLEQMQRGGRGLCDSCIMWRQWR